MGDRHGMRMYTTCISVPMGIGMDVHVQYICTYGDRHGMRMYTTCILVPMGIGMGMRYNVLTYIFGL